MAHFIFFNWRSYPISFKKLLFNETAKEIQINLIKNPIIVFFSPKLPDN